MRPIYEIGVIHVESTNACNKACNSCTRFVGHHQKCFFMNLDTVRKAISSLDGFQGKIGLMGGEPTIHPQFREICKIFQEMVPKERRALWSNGYKWKEYEDIIYETFKPENIVYNEHKETVEGVHQPLLIAAKDVIEDEKLMWELIDDCWINKRWSASMTPKGAFFCEVAAAQDHLFNGPGGYPLEKGWWKKMPDQYRDQVKRYCPNCSAAIPMPGIDAHSSYEYASKSIADKLKELGSPKFLRGQVKIYDKKFTREEIEKNAKNWMPWSHRPFKQFTPDLIIYER